MVGKVQLSPVVLHKRLWYGFGAACIGLVALLLLLSFSKNAGLAAPLAPTAITITKSSTTSIIGTNNTASQAVAGELVTVTVVYTISAGESLYNVSPRVLLQDGLMPYASDPAWITMTTGTMANLRIIEPQAARNGAIVVFPYQGDITGPRVLTMTVYARRPQYLYVTSGEIGHNTNLRVQAVLRWCVDAACSSQSFSNEDTTAAQITAIRPALATTITPVYLDADGIGVGGGQARFTFNTTNTAGRPTTYDVVFTATLGSGLTYVASSGDNDAGPGTVSVVGGVTYIVWNVPVGLAGGASWRAIVTATLPTTFTVGQGFTAGYAGLYETFAGPMLDEGKYTLAATQQTLYPPALTVVKTSVPGGGAVTMGDRVTYTVVFKQGANTLLRAPQIVDTQPLGFHYISGTLEVQNATVTSVGTSQGTTEGTGAALRHYENLTWTMSDLPPVSTTRVVTATYVALNTGLDYNNLPVYTLAADLKASKPTISGTKTGAVLSWTPPAGSTYSSATRANAGALGVIQPFMGDNFSTVRTDAGAREVGQDLQFSTRFRNNGYSAAGIPAIPAYELQICDTLPAGLVFQTDNGCFLTGTSNTCSFSYTPPSVGATGAICWSVPALEKRADTNTYEFRYAVRVTDAAYPGVYGNLAFVKTYSSKAGTVEGERVYADIPTALASATCGANCYTILGLNASKTTARSRVAPGDLITYVLAYTDTSAANLYTGLVVVDTYDSLLTFVSANPAPSNHNVGARQLTWNLGALPDNTSDRITLVMRVAATVAGRYMITNTMMLDSDQTAPRTWIKTTPIEVATLHLSMSGPARTHAGEDIVYTVVYSNTGSWNNAPVTLTLTYGNYVTFVSASRTPVDAEKRVFVDNVPNDGSNRTLTVNLRVQAPLPYTLAGPLMASALLESPGAATQSANISMLLDRPILTLEKIGPAVAPGQGNIIPYEIRIRNSGTYTATSAVITDTWSAHLTYNATANSAFGWTLSGSGTYATQALPPLAPGAVVSRSFYANVGAMATYYTNTVDLTTYQTTRQTDTEWTWQVTIASSKSAMPVPAFPGRVLTYTIYYTNTGGAMLNALITDTLPAAFTYQGQSTEHAGGCQDPWTFTPPSAGNQVVWSCNALQAAASGYFQIWGVVDVNAEGTNLENRTTTSADNTPVRPIEKPLLTRVARPWLRVDKTAAPTHPVAPGDRVTYTLTYENYGTDTAYGVIIKDQLPPQMDFISCSGADSCAESGGVVTWNLAELPVSTIGTVQFVAQVKAGTAGQTAINEDYTIECSLLSIAETQTGDAVSTVILEPHVSVTKTATPTLVTVPNAPITYTIAYVNDGGGTLTNVVLTDELAIKTQFSSASPGCQGPESGVGGVVNCALGTLAQGQSGEVQIVVLAATEGLITNTAVIDSDQTSPLETTPPTQVYFSTGGCIPPYNVDFTVSPNPLAGKVITFTGVALGDTPLSYEWTFGDSSTGSGQIVQHTYAVSNTYTVRLTVWNTCNPAGVNVQKSVFVPGAAEITWTPTSFAKSAEAGSTTSLTDTLRVGNVGAKALLWSVEVSPTTATWLKVSTGGGMPSGSLTGLSTAPDAQTLVTVHFDPTGLAVGTYNAVLHIVSNDPDASDAVVDIPVTFTITGAPVLAWTPTSFSKSAEAGSTTSLTDTLKVNNNGNVVLQWSVEVSPTTATWLKVSTGGGTPSGSLTGLSTAPDAQTLVTVHFDPTGLAVGTYNAVLHITSDDPAHAVVDIPVTFTITGAPVLAWMPESFSNSAEVGSTTSLTDTLKVNNNGNVVLLWSVEVSPTTATWLKVSTGGGTPSGSLTGLSTAPGAQTLVTVHFDPTGLAVGTYNAVLHITSDDLAHAVVNIPATFTVVRTKYFIFLPLVLRNQ